MSSLNDAKNEVALLTTETGLQKPRWSLTNYEWVGGRLVCACMQGPSLPPVWWSATAHVARGPVKLFSPLSTGPIFFKRTAKPVLCPCLLVSVFLQAKGNDCLRKCWNQTSHDNTEQMAVVLFKMVSISHTKKAYLSLKSIGEPSWEKKIQEILGICTQKMTKSERATRLGREREETGKGTLMTPNYDYGRNGNS